MSSRCRERVDRDAERRRPAAGSVCSTRPAGMPAGTPPSKCDMRAGRDPVVPAVEVADEADHLRLAGEGAGEPERQMRGLRAGGREAHALGAGDQAIDQLGPPHLQLVRGAPVRAERHLALDRPRRRPDGRGPAAARRGRRSSRRTRCRRRPTCAGRRHARHRSDRAAACGYRASDRPGCTFAPRS